MAFRDSADTRDLTREALKRYTTKNIKSTVQVAKEIDASRADLAPRKRADRAAIDQGVISRFIVGRTGTQPGSVEMLYRFCVFVGEIVDPDIHFRTRIHADPVFELLKSFFSVSERNIDICKSFSGMFNIFFRSEDLRDRIVVGCIEFQFDGISGACRVSEYQRNRISNAVENWNGYFFVRRHGQGVIILKGEGRLDSLPKFYILRFPHLNDNNLATEIRGMMLKMGTDGGVYTVPALLRRRDDARDRCDVYALQQFPEEMRDVLTEIDPRRHR